MRSDYRDHATGSEQQPVSSGLQDGIRRFLPNFGSISIDDGVLAHPATNDALKDFLRFIQRRRGLTVVPVDDGEY
jgi:hypothetical protein